MAEVMVVAEAMVVAEERVRTGSNQPEPKSRTKAKKVRTRVVVPERPKSGLSYGGRTGSFSTEMVLNHRPGGRDGVAEDEEETSRGYTKSHRLKLEPGSGLPKF